LSADVYSVGFFGRGRRFALLAAVRNAFGYCGRGTASPVAAPIARSSIATDKA
jgi:hypothetical protein